MEELLDSQGGENAEPRTYKKSADEVAWKGESSLEQFLVPIDEILDNPKNSNINPQVQEIAASLQRWGQVHPVTWFPTLVAMQEDQPAQEVKMMVRGHHTRQAARLLGWTHIAANRHRFETRAEANLYMNADNQLASLAERDVQAQLDVLVEVDDLSGSGYTIDDVETFQDQLQLTPVVELADAQREHAEDADSAAARAAALAQSERHRQFVLLMKEADAQQFSEDVQLLMKHYGITSNVETVRRAVHSTANGVRAL